MVQLRRITTMMTHYCHNFFIPRYTGVLDRN